MKSAERDVWNKKQNNQTETLLWEKKKEKKGEAEVELNEALVLILLIIILFMPAPTGRMSANGDLCLSPFNDISKAQIEKQHIRLLRRKAIILPD